MPLVTLDWIKSFLLKEFDCFLHLTPTPTIYAICITFQITVSKSQCWAPTVY